MKECYFPNPIEIPEDFYAVISKAAETDNIPFSQALIKMAIDGAECRRLHGK